MNCRENGGRGGGGRGDVTQAKPGNQLVDIMLLNNFNMCN